MIAASAFPCFAEYELSAPVEQVDEPIPMSYSAIGSISASAVATVRLFKSGEQIRSTEEKASTNVSVREVDGNLEVTFVKKNLHFSSTNVQATASPVTTCLMRRSGVRLNCDTSSDFFLPIYDRDAYRTGDRITLPIFNLEDELWIVEGTIKGRASYEHRPILLVDFADSRNATAKGVEFRVDAGGYAYLDIATGFPLVMDLSMNMRGAFQGFDRALLSAEIAFAIDKQDE